jgi:hypothetical protein
LVADLGCYISRQVFFKVILLLEPIQPHKTKLTFGAVWSGKGKSDIRIGRVYFLGSIDLISYDPTKKQKNGQSTSSCFCLPRLPDLLPFPPFTSYSKKD